MPLVAIAAALGVLLLGGVFLAFGKPSQPAIGVPWPSPTTSPSPSPTTSPSPAPERTALPSPPADIDGEPLPEAYVSKDNALTIRFPRYWSVTPPSMTRVNIDDGLLLGPSAYDVVASDDSRFMAVSGWLRDGETAADSIAAYDGRSFPVNGPCQRFDPAERPRVPIGDRNGFLTVAGCTMNGPYKTWFRAYAEAGERVWLFQLDTDSLGRRDFEAFLGKVTLDPGPIVRPPLAKVYTSDRYGYTIRYPEGWTVEPVRPEYAEPWIGRPGLLGFDYVGTPETRICRVVGTACAGPDAGRVDGGSGRWPPRQPRLVQPRTVGLDRGPDR